MNGRLGWVVVLTLSGWAVRPLDLPAQTPEIPDPVKSGRELAERLRKAGPAKSASFDGLMSIVRTGKTNTVPIASRIVVTETNWYIRYVAGTGSSAEVLTVERSSSKPNQYYSSDPTTNTAAKQLSTAELFQPFANSDFWRIDLGQEFFFWPEQRQIKNQMRRGRACRVLESRNPKALPGTYGRVVSWIDVETDGILKAEAYDERDRLVKEFLVVSFRKVEGQYHLEEMAIRNQSNQKTGEETRIRFDLSR
jgi:Outer membrane lipoprotein-sorting protein